MVDLELHRYICGIKDKRGKMVVWEVLKGKEIDTE